MYKQFLEAVLPSQGNYCIFTLRGGKEPKQKFFENGALEDTYKYIEKLKEQPVDIYFALSSFEGFSRKAQESLYLKSLFLDIDVGKASNSYDTKTEAWEALIKFVEDTGLPGPVVVDSGNGLHVYWILKEAITVDEWKPYATSLLKLCQQHKLIIDPAVPADAARVLRVPNTNNYGKNFQEGDTPKKVEVVGGEVVIHDLDEIANCFGEIEVPKEKSLDIEGVRAGLTEEEIKLRDKYNEEYYEKLNKNYSHSFKEIAEKSLEGVGCAQIKFAIEEAASCSEPFWRAVLSVAVRCDDGDTAIHELSKDYPDYDPAQTENKARDTEGPYRCFKIEEKRPGGCEGCVHKGKIAGPIALGRHIRVAQPGTNDAAESTGPEKEKIVWPEKELYPFVRFATGGFGYEKEVSVGSGKNKTTTTQVISVLPYDFIPIKRMYHADFGESLFAKLYLPRDGRRDLVLPMKHVYATEKFKEFCAFNGIFADMEDIEQLRRYVVKWIKYLVQSGRAEDIRDSMGWAHEPNGKYGSFVVGEREVTSRGIVECPVSPNAAEVKMTLVQSGTFEGWKNAADLLDQPGFELHAIGLYAGLGSVLLPLMNRDPKKLDQIAAGAPGMTLSFCGKGGAGKTGAAYAGISLWGNPKLLEVKTERGATPQALQHTAGTYGCLPLYLDEATGITPDRAQAMIYESSNDGVGRRRMSSSANVMRTLKILGTRILLMSANEEIVGKLFAKTPDPSGTLRRILEFNVHKKVGQLPNDLGKKMFQPYTTNYGIAGPMFIEYLYTLGIDEVQRTLEKWWLVLNSRLKNATDYSFWVDNLAAMFAGAEVAVRGGIITHDIDRILEVVLVEVDKIRREIESSRIDYVDIVQEYLASNINSYLAFNEEGKVISEPRNDTIKIRAEYKEGRHIVSIIKKAQSEKNFFLEYLQKKNLNRRDFEATLEDRKILIDRQKKVRIASGWKNLEINVYCYQFDFTDLNLAQVLNDRQDDTAA
jgi:hypothetical protein